jgi:hypothetical protein
LIDCEEIEEFYKIVNWDKVIPKYLGKEYDGKEYIKGFKQINEEEFLDAAFSYLKFKSYFMRNIKVYRNTAKCARKYGEK